jgi:hypothetical protein
MVKITGSTHCFSGERNKTYRTSLQPSTLPVQSSYSDTVNYSVEVEIADFYDFVTRTCKGAAFLVEYAHIESTVC